MFSAFIRGFSSNCSCSTIPTTPCWNFSKFWWSCTWSPRSSTQSTWILDCSVSIPNCLTPSKPTPCIPFRDWSILWKKKRINPRKRAIAAMKFSIFSSRSTFASSSLRWIGTTFSNSWISFWLSPNSPRLFQISSPNSFSILFGKATILSNTYSKKANSSSFATTTWTKSPSSPTSCPSPCPAESPR